MCIRDRGAGVVACEQRHSLSEGELAAFEDLFGQVALIEWVDGKLLSTASAIAGCGPAFAAMFPVSYTHLDVYKRQRQNWGLLPENGRFGNRKTA